MRGHDTGFTYHLMLLEDAERMAAYERALRRLVQPGMVVLDVGAGTGILAMLAARLGAARVHAVESMPVARVARQLVGANGLAGRVVVHEADLVTLAPVEPVDLVVSDFLGAYLVDDRMLSAMEAAARWLKPGAAICPRRVKLWLAPAGEFFDQQLSLLESPFYGLDLGAALPYALNATRRGHFPAAWLVGPPRLYAEVIPPARAPFDATLHLPIERDAELRGLIGWFEAELADGVTLSTAPGIDTHWGQYLFPLPRVRAAAGDEVEVTLRLEEEEPFTEWRWHGRAAGVPFDLDTYHRWGERSAPAPAAVATGEGEPLFHAGDYDGAARAWERDVAAGGAPPDWENLGIAYLHATRYPAAIRAFLRALDGDLGSREQSLRLLVLACRHGGRPADAARYQQAYEARYGPWHP